MKVRFEANAAYCYFFDYSTGRSVTMGDSEKMQIAKGPNLLDVSITNRCNRCCDFCYRQSKYEGDDISIEDYKVIIENAQKCGVQQIAIGGGEPTLHPNFCEILEMTRRNGIVPNYSTNGHNLTQKVLRCTQKNCGAIAISVYEYIDQYETIVSKIKQYNIKTNLHIILRADKLASYISFLKKPPIWFKDLNAIIFLNYKPANGDDSLCLNKCDPEMIKGFFEAIKSFDICGIGFDTCAASYVCRYLGIDSCYYDFCEAARKSAYINEKLNVFPCSFYKEGYDSLRKDTLKDIWNKSKVFETHRQLVLSNNGRCEKLEVCHCSCPLYQISACAKNLSY